MRASQATASADPFVLFPMRLGLSVVFAAHGIDKLTGFSGWSAFVASLGFPAPDFFAGAVVAAELLGALCLLAGVLTRTAAVVLSGVILVAIVTTRLPGPIVGNLDLDIAVLAGTITLALNGAGRPTLASVLSSDRPAEPAQAP